MMALGLLGLLVVNAIPTTVGVGQAVSAQKKQNASQKEKAQFQLTSTFRADGSAASDADEAYCVLLGDKLYVDHADSPVKAHRFDGYYFTYPSEEQHRGLVSTIQDDPPMLNWIFVDADTRAVRYAGRKDTVGHVIGPWGWSDDDKWLMLRGSEEGFMVVKEEEDSRWAVYWDPDGELRKQKEAEGLVCVATLLRRRLRLGMESCFVKDK